MVMQTKTVIDGRSNSAKVLDFTQDDIDNQKSFAAHVALEQAPVLAKAEIRTSGITKATSLGFTQEQAEMMFK